MFLGPQLLVTLCLFKPGVWSHVLGKIFRKVQQNGFTVVGLRVVVLDTSTAKSLLHTNKVILGLTYSKGKKKYFMEHVCVLSIFVSTVCVIHT